MDTGEESTGLSPHTPCPASPHTPHSSRFLGFLMEERRRRSAAAATRGSEGELMEREEVSHECLSFSPLIQPCSCSRSPPRNPSRHCTVAAFLLEEELIRRGSTSTGSSLAPWRPAAAALARRYREQPAASTGGLLVYHKPDPSAAVAATLGSSLVAAATLGCSSAAAMLGCSSAAVTIVRIRALVPRRRRRRSGHGRQPRWPPLMAHTAASPNTQSRSIYNDTSELT